MIRPFSYHDRTLFILDQRLLPLEEKWLPCTSAEEVARAIRTLAVRGAPAIGIAAAYGLVLAAPMGIAQVEAAARILTLARPTAVNLSWAVRRCLAAARFAGEGNLQERLREEADAIWAEEVRANESMATLGAGLFDPGRTYSILTHCNAGSLATGGMGTAVGVIRRLHEQGKLSRAYMDETRPLLQGARITAYELNADGIPCTLITDSMAGWLMKLGRIDAVIVGADRIACNLDAANKVGSYSLAVLAHAHGVPFFIVAPRSTFDPDISTGEEIPIEERSPEEVLTFQGSRSAPQVDVFNPAFDVVPHRLITALITEDGILRPG
ncbi:MAG: S-methyl-5-thioribose-1-phosphate isomerase [Desulfobacterota bacterium]|nr:S-methyl-5-thioribose-1-phosphate isomerase [Thermodesulfobacteriota bacterium]